MLFDKTKICMFAIELTYWGKGLYKRGIGHVILHMVQVYYRQIF